MRQVLVLVVIGMAGCSGVFGGTATDGGQAVTPAPVPTASEGDVRVPQTADGTPDVGRIISSHRRALSTRTFHRRTVIDGNLSATDVWVDREANRTRVRRVTDTTTDVILADGQRYERAENGSVLTEDAGARPPVVETTSGFFLLQRYVAGLVYNRTATVTGNGTELAVLRANTTDSTISRSGSRTVLAANSTLYVDRDGIIRAMNHRERYADGTVRTVRFRVRAGGDSVAIPDWYERESTVGSFCGPCPSARPVGTRSAREQRSDARHRPADRCP